MQLRCYLVTAFVLALAACDNQPAAGKTEAVVAAPVTAAAPTAGGTTHKFSNDGSKLDWVGAKVSKKEEGSFAGFSGTINLVDKDALKSAVTAEIDMSSVRTASEQLQNHLKSPDFFDVEKFPKSRFTSTSIVAGGEGGKSHTVTGNFELHGVTKSIKFPADIRVADSSVEVDAEFAINRKDFGVVYPGMPDDLISDDVLLKLQIRAKPAT